MEFLSPEKTLKFLEISETSILSKDIADLKEEIERETHVAELRCSVTGVIDPVQVQKIVGMKLHLDSLYIDWVNSKMS